MPKTEFIARAKTGVLVAAIAAFVLCGCGPESKPAAKPESPPIRVAVHPAGAHPMERVVTALGSLQAMDRATVSIKTTGRLRLLHVDVGSPVKAGDVLAQVEPRDYELRVQQSAALLAQARARLGLPLQGDDDTVDLESVSTVREAKALFEEATRTQERIRRLQSEKISSQAELERAEADYQVTMNRYHDAMQEARERKAILAQRRAEYDIARQQLSDTSLRAPFDGVVQERITNVGEFLAGGSPVLSLVRVDPLRIRLEIPERQAHQIRTNQPVRVRFEGLTNLHTGVISRVSPALDERTRMLVVEAELRNPGNLRPGAFVRADVVTEPAQPALAVPSESIITFAGTEKLLVVQTNRAVERRITTGRRLGGWVEVLAGIKAGDPIVRRPTGVAAGDRVEVDASATGSESPAAATPANPAKTGTPATPAAPGGSVPAGTNGTH